MHGLWSKRGLFPKYLFVRGLRSSLGLKQGSPREHPAVPVRLSHRSESLMGRFSDGLDVLFHYAG